jgi:hypothetical protein
MKMININGNLSETKISVEMDARKILDRSFQNELCLTCLLFCLCLSLLLSTDTNICYFSYPENKPYANPTQP